MAEADEQRRGASTPAIAEAPTGGFPCPHCGARTLVTDSRPTLYGWRRRRKCLGCTRRFSTVELISTNDIEAAMAFRRRVLPRLRALVRLADALEEGDDEIDDFKDPR